MIAVRPGLAALSAVAVLTVVLPGPAAAIQEVQEGGGLPGALPPGATVLDVPYLPQDELLCGGASAAMVLRYWGMENVLPTDFSPLISPSLGGMRARDLAANLARLGWDPILFTGRFEEIRRHIRLGRPVITLIEVTGGRFHYVVVTGELDEQLVVHDPAASPFRLMSREELERAWERTGGLSLLVLPSPGRGPNVRLPDGVKAGSADYDAGAQARAGAQDAGDARVHEPGPGKKPAARPLPALCRLSLADAIDLAHKGRTDEAAALLSDGECATQPAFLRELAGVRLRQGDLDAAAGLSRAALEADPSDRHAAETLATALYLDDAPGAALDAWNRVDRPTIDLVRIAGLERTAHRPVARLLGVRGGELLTRRSLVLARRRLADLPAAAATRIAYAPTGGGRADVVAGIAERTGLPTTAIPLTAAVLRTVLRREVSLTVVSPLGRGETWSAAWRWWNRRPRVAFRFAGPAEFGPPATWTLEAAWEEESFRPDVVGAGGAGGVVEVDVVDERTGGAFGTSIWLEPWLRARLLGGAERWDGRGTFVRSGAGFDIRAAGDRLGVAANADVWVSIDGRPGFGRISANAAWMTRAELHGLVLTVRGGAEAVSRDAPPTIWPGAGVGFARRTLLRAHPLLDDGVITGPAFDRHLAAGGAEVVYWVDLGTGVRIGGAGFMDIARAWGVRPAESFADAGVGLRLGTAAHEAVLRIDIATGLDDDEFAVSAGWWIPAAFR